MRIFSMKYLTVLLFVFLPATLLAQHSLSVTVKGLRNTEGNLLLSVFRSSDGFPSDDSKALYKAKIAKIPGWEVKHIFKDIPDGSYAVSVLHDENGDLKMNTNGIGIPKEGSGASNDARGSFGPPKYADAQISIKGAAKSITINMHYY